MNTKPPVCGSISVAMPFAALLIAVGGEAFLNAFVFFPDQPHWPLAVLALGMSPLAGLTSGIVGVNRREKHVWLAVTGFTLNMTVVTMLIWSLRQGLR
jgi:hypothetical protein